jgi:hypothetical protein
MLGDAPSDDACRARDERTRARHAGDQLGPTGSVTGT